MENFLVITALTPPWVMMEVMISLLSPISPLQILQVAFNSLYFSFSQVHWLICGIACAFSGSLGSFTAANLIVAGSNARNVVINGNYQGFIVHSGIISLQVTDSVFDQCSHPTNGHLVYIRSAVNSTSIRASVFLSALTVSNSANVDLNGGVGDVPMDFTYSGINFQNVTNSDIINVLSPSAIVENIYFSRFFFFFFIFVSSC